MKKIKFANLILFATLFCVACTPPDSKNNQLADSSLTSEFRAANFQEELVYARAINAVIWGMPAVNTELLYEGLKASGGTFNQVIYWSKLPTWKNQTLTPNPETVYLFPFYDTRNGPVVLEIPAAGEGSITGSVDDAWQTAIEDVGPSGVDKGKGGKYLILPPGFREKVPAGFIPMPSSTFTGFLIARSNLSSGKEADVANAVAYGKHIKIYPYAPAKPPAETVFVDAWDIVYTNTIPYNLKFFETLNAFIQREPWLERDKAMIDPIKSIGIEKGKDFRPNERTRQILAAAIQKVKGWIDVEYEKLFSPPFFDGTHWALPASQEVVQAIESNYTNPSSYPFDSRGVTFSMAFFSAKHLGKGQFYLMTIDDENGHALDGSKRYHLNVPAQAPVSLYWSATVYDRETHAFIQELTRFSRSSHSPDISKNADGSVDLYFGPSALEGKETNWLPTKSGRRFEVLIRFYGPEKALFDKTWKLPDLKAIDN